MDWVEWIFGRLRERKRCARFAGGVVDGVTVVVEDGSKLAFCCVSGYIGGRFGGNGFVY